VETTVIRKYTIKTLIVWKRSSTYNLNNSYKEKYALYIAVKNKHTKLPKDNLRWDKQFILESYHETEWQKNSCIRRANLLRRWVAY